MTLQFQNFNKKNITVSSSIVAKRALTSGSTDEAASCHIGSLVQ
jgi:hypothetical protein